MKKISIVIISVFFFLNTFAQSYIGHTVDNFAGIHGVIYNPANVVSSNLRADINLLSGSAFVGSDYFGVNFDNATEIGDFDFEDDAQRFPSEANNFFGNTDVVGPSFMFNLSKKSSIGLVSRGRGFFNANEINGVLFENLIENFDEDEDFSFNSSNLNVTAHSWAEIGLAYGRILIDKPNHMLSGGVTLKYLIGAGALFVDTPGLQGNFDASTEIIDSQGALNYGTTQGFDTDDVNFDNISSGFGLDVGFVYEWHPKRDSDNPVRFYQDPYRLKIGVSVTDIGSITYDNAEVKQYDLNARVSTNTDDDVQDFLDNNYENSTSNQSVEIQLPTTLRLLVDYRLAKKWLISAQADLSLINSSQVQSNRMINTYTLTPRLETKWLTLFVPIGLRQYDEFAMGAGFRFGPLSIGSGSILSSLVSDNSQTADVFLGLKIPIYRK